MDLAIRVDVLLATLIVGQGVVSVAYLLEQPQVTRIALGSIRVALLGFLDEGLQDSTEVVCFGDAQDLDWSRGQFN